MVQSLEADPDGDKLTFKWWVLAGAGTCKDEVVISGADSSRATVAVPPGAGGQSIHVICEVTDDGTHTLNGYRRIILEPAGAAIEEQKREKAAVIAKPRVIVSTDIGGTDPDDFQSMVHLLVYADVLDLEGLISSPFGPGRKEHILQVIDCYDRDYSNLKMHSERYPTPDALRAITKQGETEGAPHVGVRRSTEGSEWIVKCARRNDPRPLQVLVWGGIEDLAQALHDAPDILPRLRVYFIGGPNKKWSVDAYNYVEQNHPKLWMIEANATYRGWFVGGNQQGEWGNKEFVAQHIAGHGALGDYFATKLKGTIKMGDTPSVARLIHGTPEDPTQPSWGGKYVRIWDGRKIVFDRLTTEADTAEVFGVTEFALPKPEGFSTRNAATMIFDRGVPASVGVNEGNVLRFRFSPRDAKVWSYVIKSDFVGLDGTSGKFTAAPPPLERTDKPSAVHPNWWIDDPAPAAAEGVHPGAFNVNPPKADTVFRFTPYAAGESLRPEARIEVTPTEGMPPLAVAFKAVSDAAQVEWDFGDGSKTTGREAKHTFTQSGVHTVTLKVTDKNGVSAVAYAAERPAAAKVARNLRI